MPSLSLSRRAVYRVLCWMCSCIFITHPHTSWRVMYEIMFSINRAYSRSTTTYLVLPRSPIAHHLQCEQYNCFGVMGSLPFVYSSQAVSRSYFPHSSVASLCTNITYAAVKPRYTTRSLPKHAMPCHACMIYYLTKFHRYYWKFSVPDRVKYYLCR